MNLTKLLEQLATGNHTMGWGALVAISRSALNETLAASYAHAVANNDSPAAFSSTVNLLADRSEFANLSELSLGAPVLQLGGVHGTPIAKVQWPLVAGTAVYRRTNGVSSGMLMSTQIVAAQAGYALTLEARVEVKLDSFANALLVFLDIAGAVDARCNLTAYDEGNARLAQYFLDELKGGSLASQQLLVATVPLDARDLFSPTAVSAVVVSNPEAAEDEALLLGVGINALNTGDGGIAPGPTFPFLIADDTGPDGRLKYPCTCLVDERFAPLLPEEAGTALPALLSAIEFAGGKRFNELERYATGHDLAIFGELAATGATAELVWDGQAMVADEHKTFSVRMADGSQPPVVTWSVQALTAGAGAGAIASDGTYTAPGPAAFPRETVQVAVSATFMAGGKAEVRSAYVTLRKQPLQQGTPVQLLNRWRSDTAQALRAFSGQAGVTHWALRDAPLPGEAVVADPATTAIATYTPPSAITPGLDVRWAKASGAAASGKAENLDLAGVILLSYEHRISVEPAYFDQPLGSQGLQFSIARNTAGALLLGGGAVSTSSAAGSWSVKGEGSITADGHYTPAVHPSLPFDIVYYDTEDESGYAVVMTRVQTTAAPTWTQLSKFELTVHGSPTLYANGAQQVAVEVKIVTQGVGSVEDPLDIPITPGQLATLRLIDQSQQDVPQLPPYIEGVADQQGWATSTTPNRYSLYGQGTPAAGPLAERDRTRTKTLYLQVNQTLRGQPIQKTFAARFVSVGADGLETRWDSNGAEYGGPTEITITVLPVPVFSRSDYRFPDGSDATPQPAEPPTLWTGQPYRDENGNADYYSTAENTSTLYALGLAQPGLRFVSLGLRTSSGEPGTALPNLNQARWESDYWGEGGFSYTGVAFEPPTSFAASLPDESLGLGEPLRRLDQQLRPAAGLPARPPAKGPWPVTGMPVPVLDRPAVRGVAGEVSVVLERRGDMAYQWANDTDEQALVAYKAALARPLALALRDTQGNPHQLWLHFQPETAQSSGRNYVQLGLAAPRGAGGSGTSSAPPQAPGPSTALHSNAFNFASFLQGGVDPRTGQYALNISLPEVNANDLAGPGLPLRLGFDPINTLDSGFGTGWSFNLSHVDTQGKRRLRLSSGESFTLDSVSGSEWFMTERKVPVCRLFTEGNGYKLVHRDGTLEFLGVPNGVGQLALPYRVESPLGHCLHLQYGAFQGTARLERIYERHADATERDVFSVVGSNEGFELRFPVDGGTAGVFRVTQLERELTLSLPTETPASWRVHFIKHNGYRCIERVESPVGAVETLVYDNPGQRLPGHPENQALPRVKTHTVSLGEGRAPVVTAYAWSMENFLGYPALSDFEPERDNLYRVAWGFEYWSEQQVSEGNTLRKTRRTYNSLHLLVEECTEQAGHSVTVCTEYHWLANQPFEAQPAQCQLPKTVTTTWRREADQEGQPAPLPRSETVTTEYDSHANLRGEWAANGVHTGYTYYPGGEASEGCPADPWGFTQYEHTRTVTPSGAYEPGAAVLCTTSTWCQVPRLAGAVGNGPVQLRSEAQVQVAGTGRRVERTQGDGVTVRARYVAEPVSDRRYDYYMDRGDALRLGRLQNTSEWFAGKEALATTTAYTYTSVDVEGQGRALATAITTLGHDGTTRQQRTEQSVQSGLMLLERDDQAEDAKVDVRRCYDALRRVMTETIAPGTPQQATRAYSYRLLNTVGGCAEQTTTDVKGLRLRTLVDGLGRPVEEYRREPGEEAEMLTFEAAYNAFGQMTQATVHDDFGPVDPDTGQRQVVALTEQYAYDHWGELCATLGADGVRRIEVHDPLGLPAEGAVRVTRAWQENATCTVVSGVQETWLNAFDQPLRTHRYESDEAPPSHIYRYRYDGLGRQVAHVDPQGSTTGYTYDAFDRALTETRPGGAWVTRRYADHSHDDLPVFISISHLEGSKPVERVLGTQTFDGVGRLTEAVTGGRKRVFGYTQAQTQPDTVVTPAGSTLKYEYTPRLSDAPRLRQVVGVQNSDQHYIYDDQDARLLRCLNGTQEVLSRQYHSNGRLRSETRLHGQQTLSMGYRYSVAERLLGFTDVNGESEAYTYGEEGGQLARLDRPGLRCDVAYDELGRSHCVATQDTDAGIQLTTTLGYDAYGRETSRVFTFGPGQDETLSQAYDELDRICSKTLATGTPAEAGELLRAETFAYDALGHLEIYTCEGPECPLDPYGHRIDMQVFSVDALDNHTEVVTFWDGLEQLNTARYCYENPDDPAQLTGICNDGEGYPAEVVLGYDADGNLTNDEWGRTFRYDVFGRLVEVTGIDAEPPSYYHYDPLDIIAARSEAPQATGEGRFYCDGQLHTLLEQGQATTIIRAGDHLVAEQTHGATPAGGPEEAA